VQALAGDEAAAETKLRVGKTARFTGRCLVHAGDFEKDVSRENNSHPELRGTLTFTHSDFRRALSNGLVREDPAEDLAFTLQEAGDCDSAGFDMNVFDPAALKRLKSKITKVELVAAGGVSTAVATL
jgi:hypothetical protein